jgi:hypothetical protein
MPVMMANPVVPLPNAALTLVDRAAMTLAAANLAAVDPVVTGRASQRAPVRPSSILDGSVRTETGLAPL